jgi:hypothetical protein
MAHATDICCSENLHIDWGKGTVGDGAADSASQGESGVERDTGQLLCRRSCSDGGHCEGCDVLKPKRLTVGGSCEDESGFKTPDCELVSMRMEE